MTYRALLAKKLYSNLKILKPDECWEWQGYKNKKGYGRLSIKNKKFSAHRASFLVHNGEAPAELMVCHRCDNPSCCNPNHLYLGTARDNNLDAFSKGRNLPVGVHVQKGQNNHKSIYTEQQVLEMRRLHKDGCSIKDLIERFGGSRGGVYAILARKTWTHLAEDGG